MKNNLFQYPKSFSLPFAICVFVLFTLKTNAQPINFSNCPTCSAAQIAVHTEINTKYLGVKGTNPLRPSTYNLIGSNKFADYGPFGIFGGFADAFIGDNWYPIRKEKQTLVGTLTRFGVANYGDESDWNIIIKPDEGFESLISDALKIDSYNTDEWNVSSDGKYMIEAEITPITNAFNNLWFNNKTGITPLKNKKIGVYGPFVTEEIHGNRPEIHPAEQIWWKENDNTTIILLGADASNRFDNDSDYSTDNVVGEYHPWTQDAGQQAELRIPFEINPTEGSLAYSINNLWYENRFFSNAPNADQSSGTKHSIIYNGNQALTVMESPSVEKYIGVRFDEVCFDNNKKLLKGYIVLKTAIGNGGEGKEGFVALQIYKELIEKGEVPAIMVGNIVGTANSWTTLHSAMSTAFPTYDNSVNISEIISSDKDGKGILDGMIDFNGNGKTDLFSKQGNKWMVLYDGKGKWTEINTEGKPLNTFHHLRFGDVNGDGKTDILTIGENERLLVSWGGTSKWDDYSHVNVPISNIRVGDFNGDGKTDLVKMVLGGYLNTSEGLCRLGSIMVKYGCSGEWQELQDNFYIYPNDYEERFRFGNFNGDKITDIFRYYKGKFMVYYNGRDYLQDLCTPLITDINVNDLLFVNNLSRVNYTDIIYVGAASHAWKIYYEGKTTSGGRILQYPYSSRVHFGKLLGDDNLWRPFTVDNVKDNTPHEFTISNANTAKIEPFVMAKYEAGSIKRTVIDGKPALTMNMNLQYYQGSMDATGKRGDYQSVTAVKEKGKAKLFSYKTKPLVVGEEKILGQIENVPLTTKENQIEVKYAAMQSTDNYDIDPYGIGALSSKITETSGTAGNWNSWKNYFASKINPKYSALLTNAPAAVEKINTVSFKLFPFYSSLEEDKVSIMEMGDALKELNGIVYGTDSSKIVALFGDSKVFAIQWKFELKNLVTGNLIPITNANTIATSENWVNSNISYEFPNQNDLLEFKAIASITDLLGNKSIEPIEFVFYNQRLKFTNSETEIKTWLEKIRLTSAETYPYLIKKADFQTKDNMLTIAEMKILLK